ncbi:MAG: hypothetical protein VX593_06990 [Pseudomonadota bacterium]|nr:hypothetical protein [Pseudomonadota bacterium]
MPRLKVLLACAGLSSLKRRKPRLVSALEPEPIRRPLEDNSADQADEWLFDHQPEATSHGRALDTLTRSMMRLRESLSGVAAYAPITVEPEPAFSLGACSFDGDLFEGEPMLASTRAGTAIGLDHDLFEDAGNALVFGEPADQGALYRHAA